MLLFTYFQLNSHLSTLANIHKIYHTLNKLNLTEDVGQDDHQTGSLRSCSSSDCFSKVMPPRKKRRPASGDDLSAKKSRHDSMYRKYESTRIKTDEEAFSSKRCLEWFYEYAGTDDVVGPEGMEKFCEDIGVEPENVVMLVLAWKLDAQNMGYFTLQEWLKGMTALQAVESASLTSPMVGGLSVVGGLFVVGGLSIVGGLSVVGGLFMVGGLSVVKGLFMVGGLSVVAMGDLKV
ncbi:hypothetical protein U0070_003032 [Myodes glareolus]|uniref:DCN1-like protein n=1 Tax=Myodes glareolus TaxID=447135 RepID=A0AAW0I0Q4_MYOGA